jgi:hypothetical protein
MIVPTSTQQQAAVSLALHLLMAWDMGNLLLAARVAAESVFAGGYVTPAAKGCLAIA